MAKLVFCCFLARYLVVCCSCLAFWLPFERAGAHDRIMARLFGLQWLSGRTTTLCGDFLFCLCRSKRISYIQDGFCIKNAVYPERVLLSNALVYWLKGSSVQSVPSPVFSIDCTTAELSWFCPPKGTLNSSMWLCWGVLLPTALQCCVTVRGVT